MPRSRLPKASLATLRAIEAHWRASGRGPSHGELGRALGCSRQRISPIVADLERRGLIVRTRGQAHSIRPAGPDPTAEISDVDILHAVRARGLVDMLLLSAFRAESLATMDLADRRAVGQLLSQLDGVGVGADRGQSEGEEAGEGPTALSGAAGAAPGGDAASRCPTAGGDRRNARRAA